MTEKDVWECVMVMAGASPSPSPSEASSEGVENEQEVLVEAPAAPEDANPPAEPP